MDIKLFEDFEKLLRNANCPEHVFGETKDASIKKLIAEKHNHLSEISKDPKDANQEFRVRTITSLFLRFEKWAEEKNAMGVYGNYAPYRLKILFQVRIKEGAKEFLLVRNPHLRTEKINAFYFNDEYVHSDKVCILREGVPLKMGTTCLYGGQGAVDRFRFHNEDSKMELDATDFEEYDVVEIETWKYGSFDEFIHDFF